jgi:hypothetical protein
VLLQWIPAHRGIERNKRADRLATGAIEEESLHNLPNLASRPSPRDSLNPPNHDISKTQRYHQRFAVPINKMVLSTQHIGVYTWQLDGALPGPHITAVYNALTAAEASILS